MNSMHMHGQWTGPKQNVDELLTSLLNLKVTWLYSGTSLFQIKTSLIQALMGALVYNDIVVFIVRNYKVLH